MRLVISSSIATSTFSCVLFRCKIVAYILQDIFPFFIKVVDFVNFYKLKYNEIVIKIYYNSNPLLIKEKRCVF